VRGAGTEIEPKRLLDSLSRAFVPRKASTAEILENLCWNHRHHPGAFRIFLARMDLERPDPSLVLDRAQRFHSLGYWDYASRLLDKVGWRKLPKAWYPQARALYLRNAYQLKDWAAVAAETEGPRSPPLTEEEELIAAGAAVELGRPDAALPRIRTLGIKAESPWSFQARLLEARALLSQGKPAEAAAVLDGLKRNPMRKQSSGPILFWQGRVALQRGRFAAAESLLVLASAYTGNEEAQRALEYRHWLLLDTTAARVQFFRGLPEAPHPPAERMRALDAVPADSPLWTYARLEKAQIWLELRNPDSARAVFEEAARLSRDAKPALEAEAKAAFLAEKLPGGRDAALARFEDLLIKYQQGVVPEFSRGRIKALK
jgi:tetratricopeptide (TPR) repeat protein